MKESNPNGYKTLREKEKLLVTSNFSFSHSVFKKLELKTSKNQGFFGKEKQLWEKEKLLVTSNFSFFHSVFYTFRELSAIFIQCEIVCKLFSVWKSLKFAIWEKVIGMCMHYRVDKL